jgi:hypothetical protein
VRGRKALVIDPALSGPLTLLVQTSILKARTHARAARARTVIRKRARGNDAARSRACIAAGADWRRPSTHACVLAQEHGVENLYYLEAEPLTHDARAVVFLVRPRVELMPRIAAHVRALSRRARAAGGEPRDFTVLFLPRRALICDKALEEEGVLGDVTLDELNVAWLPLERDVLSAELRDGVRDAVRDGDGGGAHALARALHALQTRTTGLVPHIRGKGAAARALADALLRLRREDAAGGAPVGSAGAQAAATAPPPGWGAPALMILIDRAVDWVTPLCTQLTYEGLIDEILGIKNGTVTLPAPPPAADAAGGASAPPPAAGRKARLNSSDPLFAELRDANFGRACDALREKTASLANDYRALKGQAGAAAEVSEIGGFVKRLRDNMGGAGVDLHATIARALLDASKTRAFMARLDSERARVEGIGLDAVADHVEALCCRGAPLTQPLRLLCLATLTSGGASAGRSVMVHGAARAFCAVSHVRVCACACVCVCRAAGEAGGGAAAGVHPRVRRAPRGHAVAPAGAHGSCRTGGHE